MTTSNNPFRKKAKDDSSDSIKVEDIFSDPFGFNNRIAEFETMMQQMMDSFRTKDSSVWSTGPVYYGYSYSIGPDGKPHYQEFGNVIPKGQNRPQMPALSHEPFVDTLVDEKTKTLKVIVEMPGVRKEEINLEANEDSLRITTTGSRKYDTTVPLSVAVDSSSAKANYTNGVLEVKLKLMSSEQSKSSKIKID